MDSSRTRALWIFALIATLGLTGIVACGGDDSEPAPTDTADDAFSEAIPDADVLGLELAESGGAAQGLEFDSTQQALDGQPSRVAEHASRTLDRVNRARAVVMDLVEAARTNSPGEDVKIGALTCREWVHQADNNTWQLSSCLRAGGARGYSFVLKGKPNDAEDSAYKVVMAGDGVALPRHEGRRRGAGRIGFNLDNFNTLTGEGPTGKMGIGYRAAGRFRQLTVGLKDFTPVDGTDSFSALYRYNHLIGVGGILKFIFEADVLSVDGNGALSETKDDVDELGRVAMGWTRTGKARIAGIVCGGSLGDGNCKHMRQCYDTDEVVTFESLTDDENPVDWDATACPGEAEFGDLPELPEEPPTDGELAPPAAGGDAGAPDVAEPQADAALEGM